MALRGKAVGMNRLYLLSVIFTLFGLSGCNTKYEEVETGYKGPARTNPWLAAERFLTAYGRPVEVLSSWREPAPEDSTWIIPCELISNTIFAKQINQWMSNGGHLICLIEYSDFRDDWNLRGGEVELEPTFERFLEDHDFEIEKSASGEVETKLIRYRGRPFDVEMKSAWQASNRSGSLQGMPTAKVGDGRLTLVTDARPFRNRWIGDKQHAALLKSLVDSTDSFGTVVFVRGATLSLWSLLMERAWAVLLGLSLVIVIWLWKNLRRFGPLEAADGPSPLRAYDHHLEALGDFQWRLDRGASLLAPLRGEILEQSHRLMARSGKLDSDIFALLGERVGIPRERVARAMSEPAPTDASVFTRTVSDLQLILKSLS
jgi:hypothetical protein